MGQMPRRLRVDPIIEAIAEFRFRSNVESGAGALLLGFLYPLIRKHFEKLEQLPAAQIPQQVRILDPNLRYVVQSRLLGKKKAVLTGDQVVAVAVQAPYPGWDTFRELVAEVWRNCSASGFIESIERISVKYVNLLEAIPSTDQLRLTKVSIQLADHRISCEPTQLRTEITRTNMVSIVQFVSQATTIAEAGQAGRNGLIIDIDTIRNGPFEDFWTEFPRLLDEAHTFEKELFFSLLTDETIERYEPEY